MVCARYVGITPRSVTRAGSLCPFSVPKLVETTNEFRRYFGAQFAHDLVAFENIEYGNAIYVMFDDWEELSKKSRTELLSSRIHNFKRIPHTITWKRRLRQLIMEELLERRAEH